MNHLLDIGPLLNLYLMSQTDGIKDDAKYNTLSPFYRDGGRVIVLREVLDEIDDKRFDEPIEKWLRANGAEILERQIPKNSVALRQLKKRYFPDMQESLAASGKDRADFAAYRFLETVADDGQEYRLVAHDRGWLNYAKTMPEEFRNAKVRTYPGLFTIYLNERLNGDMSDAQFKAYFDHLQLGALSDEYVGELKALKTDIKADRNAGVPESEIRGRVDAVLDLFVQNASNRTEKVGARREVDASRLARFAIVLGTLKAAGILGDAVSVAQAAEESAWHAERGDAVKAEKAWAKLAGDLSGGTAGAAAGGGAVAASLRALSLRNPLTATIAILAGALIGGYAGGEKGKDFAGALHDYIVANNDGQALTAGLIARFARDYNNRHGILTPEELEFVRRFALSQEYQFFKREGPERFREIFGQDFLQLYGQYMLDEAGRPVTGYIATDEGDVFLTPDGKGGLREVVVPRETIDNATQIYRDEGGTYKAVPTDAGTALYEKETGAFSRLVAPGEFGRRSLKDISLKRFRSDFLAPASPHYDPEMKIDFFGTPMRAGDAVDGDPDVGDVSYFPDDNDASLTSGSRQLRFRKVPIMDLLLRDGVLRNEKGEVIRASTGRPADQVYDRFVNMQLLDRAGKPVEGGTGRSRAGLRFILSSGADAALGDVFRRAVQFPDAQGNMRGGRSFAKNEGQPFYWIFRSDLPSPEDYVLQRSGFEPGYLRRSQEAANRFVRPAQAARPALPAIAPIPRPRPHRPLPQTGPVPSARRIKG